MGKKTAPLLPYTNQMLSEFGERLKLVHQVKMKKVFRQTLFKRGMRKKVYSPRI